MGICLSICFSLFGFFFLLISWWYSSGSLVTLVVDCAYSLSAFRWEQARHRARPSNWYNIPFFPTSCEPLWSRNLDFRWESIPRYWQGFESGNSCFFIECVRVVDILASHPHTHAIEIAVEGSKSFGLDHRDGGSHVARDVCTRGLLHNLHQLGGHMHHGC
jgi:hypothetical protein